MGFLILVVQGLKIITAVLDEMFCLIYWLLITCSIKGALNGINGYGWRN
jgi:hypothetical protein